MLLRDRHDLEIGKWDRKKHTKGKVYCSRTHVFYRAQTLTERLTQYHPARSLAKITEVTEQILEEHESELVFAPISLRCVITTSMMRHCLQPPHTTFHRASQGHMDLTWTTILHPVKYKNHLNNSGSRKSNSKKV